MTKFWINAVVSTATAAIAAVLVWILASGPAVMPIVSAAGSCETLTTLTLPGGTVTLAQPVAAGGFVQPEFSDATLHLVINLVTSTIMQLVLDPPRDVTRRELLDELTRRVEEWIRGDGLAGGGGR